MITQLGIRNFRSIEEADIQLGRINVFYGPTASGKSSVLYALVALKNFIANPNRPADAFFDLGFTHLGGFDACVFNHERNREITVACTVGSGEEAACYSVAFGPGEATVKLKFLQQHELTARVTLPYPLNQNFTAQIGGLSVNWNGIAATVAPLAPEAVDQDSASKLALVVNRPAGIIKEVDIAPQKRGFYKPNYTPTPLSPIPTTDDEVASLIISDQYLAPRISVYAERILDRDFRIHTPLGTMMAFLQTTEKATRMPTLLVNDGYGVNQVIYMLAQLLQPQARVVLLEEPEVHLHPTVVRKFARELCRIAEEEDRQILLTTHSEVFLSAMLALVAGKGFSGDDLRIFFCTKEGRSSKFERQQVTPTGQIEGGLRGFIEAELEDLRTLLGL